MRQQTIEFKKGSVIEVTFATVKEGMEEQLFKNYFPKVMPLLTDNGGQSLGSFRILGALTTLDNPKMCALFQWPSLQAFKKLHSDPRFLAIKSIRDESLSFFLSGLFFNVEEDIEIQLNEDQSYLLSVVHKNTKPLISNPLVNLDKTVVASENCYQPDSIQIANWKKQSINQFNTANTAIDIYTVAINFPA